MAPLQSSNSFFYLAVCGSCLVAACTASHQQAPQAASGSSVAAVSAYTSDEPAVAEPAVEPPTSAMNWMPGKAERMENRKAEARNTRRQPERGKTVDVAGL